MDGLERKTETFADVLYDEAELMTSQCYSLDHPYLARDLHPKKRGELVLSTARAGGHRPGCRNAYDNLSLRGSRLKDALHIVWKVALLEVKRRRWRN